MASSALAGAAATALPRTPAAGAAAPLRAPAAPDEYISFTPVPGGFTLAERGRAAPLLVSGEDHPGVVRVAGDLKADIERVTGAVPALRIAAGDRIPEGGAGADSAARTVLIGTLGRSPLIDRLVESGRLDVSGLAGTWETAVQQVVDDPLPGVRRALVIVGSDPRGTVFGVYDVSRRIGVSPWYWWDDVPPRRHDALYVRPGRHTQGTPAVRYRGIFINDENPQTGTWAPGVFGPGKASGHPGGLNRLYYEKVFETLLRLKGNYLWPAVWGRAFAEDDPDNHATATRFGVVMGTSHEAPMMRGIEEWNRHPSAYGGTGEWSFVRNSAAVTAYWRDGVRRMRREGIEGVVTLGMRGNGDTSLPDGDGIELMRQIIDTQRRILAEEAGPDLISVPQVWTLYKEVQRYWDKGLRVPDDVTVVFTDDNWGNMRKLPDPSMPERGGGYGLYYHFDYVGGGRSYKWVDTVNLANTWEQLHTAHAYGVDRLWVVNVGDLKNEELPTQFFLDYAWDPAAWPVDRLPEWERGYAAQNFGPAAAPAIAEVLHTYGVLQSRRKPELTNRRLTRERTTGAVTTDDTATPFSIDHYAELDRVTGEWRRLATRAEQVGRTLPAGDQDAYYQLVLYQVKATANLHALRRSQFLNRRYAAEGRAACDRHADLAEARLADDEAMSAYYNTALAGGKWRGWQTQTKIGYGDVERYGPNAPWADPPQPDQIYPPVRRVTPPPGAEMGVAITGSGAWWPRETTRAVLPEFSPYQTGPAQYIEVFNRGATPFPYRIRPAVPWVTVTPARGTVTDQVRATVRIDWTKAPRGTTRVPITVAGPGDAVVTVDAVAHRPTRVPRRGFVEAGGYVSMEADHHTAAIGGDGVSWLRVPGIGRTGAGMTPAPPTAPARTPGGDGPRLEYRMNLFTTGTVTVWAYLSPRNPVLPGGGPRYAVSFDDDPPQVVDITAATGADDTTMNKGWEVNTSDNVNRTATDHTVSRAGVHVLKFWMVDPTVVLHKLVVDTGGLADSHLGPPESLRIGRLS